MIKFAEDTYPQNPCLVAEVVSIITFKEAYHGR